MVKCVSKTIHTFSVFFLEIYHAHYLITEKFYSKKNKVLTLFNTEFLTLTDHAMNGNKIRILLTHWNDHVLEQTPFPIFPPFTYDVSVYLGRTTWFFLSYGSSQARFLYVFLTAVFLKLHRGLNTWLCLNNYSEWVNGGIQLLKN